MKLVLGMVLDLSTCDFVLDGDPAAPPPKGDGAPLPNFRPISIVPNGWMHQDATWYGGRPQPRGIVLDGDPASPPQKGRVPPVYYSQAAAWIKIPLGA